MLTSPAYSRLRDRLFSLAISGCVLCSQVQYTVGSVIACSALLYEAACRAHRSSIQLAPGSPVQNCYIRLHAMLTGPAYSRLRDRLFSIAISRCVPCSHVPVYSRLRDRLFSLAISCCVPCSHVRYTVCSVIACSALLYQAARHAHRSSIQSAT